MSSTPGSPAPPATSNAVWWILGILGAAVVVLVLGGSIITRLIVREVRIREAGKKVAIETPMGNVEIAGGGVHKTGLPVYPGAVTRERRGGSLELSTDEDERVGIVAEHYRSPDPLEKVEVWYRERLGAEFHLERTGRSGWSSRGDHLDFSEADLAFIDDSGDAARIVALKRTREGTEIGLMRVGKRETQ